MRNLDLNFIVSVLNLGIFVYICEQKWDMAKYINPFTDIGFKRIFGQELSKPLLLDFLNSLFEEDRSLIYDIYCETDDGEKIIVEMQNKSQPFFKNRSISRSSSARMSSWQKRALRSSSPTSCG